MSLDVLCSSAILAHLRSVRANFPRLFFSPESVLVVPFDVRTPVPLFLAVPFWTRRFLTTTIAFCL